MRRGERLRWGIARLVDRLPGQCWSGLVEFALDERFLTRRRWPWAPISEACRKDAERCGACYCGKLRRPEGGEQR